MRLSLPAVVLAVLSLSAGTASAEASVPLQVIVPQPPVIVRQNLPNLVLVPSFTQYKDGAGRWTVNLVVKNTGTVAAPVGAVRVQSEMDGGGGGVQAPMGIHQQYAGTMVAPGESVTLTFVVPGAVYFNNKYTPIHLLASVAPYQLHVWIDYGFQNIPKTTESNENDNEAVFDLH